MNRHQAATLLADVLRCDHAAGVHSTLGGLSRQEWDLVVEEAVRHRLAGILYRRLHAAGSQSPGSVPILDELRDVAMRVCARNLDLFSALGRVLDCLEKHGFAAIALKGLHLTSEVYADYAARPMLDIDLLIKASDHLDAVRVLSSIGFHAGEAHRIDEWHADPQRRHVVLNDGRVPLELHRSFVPTLQADSAEIAGVWGRARRVVLAGHPCLVLCPEDLILHLCTHASLQDAFGAGLLPCFDIAATIARYGDHLDWRAIVERARQWRAERGVLLVLTLARELAGAAVPPGVLDADGYETMLAPARHRTCVLPEPGTLPSSTLARMVGPESPRAKVRLLLRSVFPRPRVIRKRYSVTSSAPGLLVGYVRHGASLIHHHGRSAWRLLRRAPETVETASVINNGQALRAWLDAEPMKGEAARLSEHPGD